MKLVNIINAIIDGPLYWERVYRRIFLLTLPISFPLWLLSIVSVLVTFLVFDGIIRFIKDMWNNV
jgi:hypothetical protein